MDSKGMFFCVFFGLCVYFAKFVTDYIAEKRDKESEPAQVHLYACAITAFASAMLTAIVSMVAMMLFGIHGGYWLVAVSLTLIAGFFMVKYLWEEVIPKTLHYCRGAACFVYFFSVGAMEVGMLGAFWAISNVTGIAVKYSCLPFKI